MQISKIISAIIYIMIKIFGIVIFLIGILLVLYYVTPNNFELNINSDENLRIQSQYDLSILKNSHHVIKYGNNSEYYLKFDTEIEMIIKNILKSQKIIMGPNKLIKINKNSTVILLNNSDKDMKIAISIYEKNKL